MPEVPITPGYLDPYAVKCPKLVRYWQEVVGIINSVYQVRLTLNPIICVLGGLKEEIYSPLMYPALTGLFYLARKFIAQYWLSPQAPTPRLWTQQVSDILV